MHRSTVIMLLAAGLAAGGCPDESKTPATAAGDPATPRANLEVPPLEQQEPEPTPATATTSGGTWAFDADPTGEVPGDFMVASGQWSVAQDTSAPSRENVIVQTAQSPRPEFNVLLLPPQVQARDVDISVELRAVRGEIDQGGGVIWRASANQDYYVARYNPLEDNLRIYRVIAGQRHQIASADVELDHAAWHTLRVTMRGDSIEGYLDDKRYLEIRDDTLKEAGQIGLWTKADAHTQFDDLTLRPVGGQLEAEAIGQGLDAEVTTTDDGVVRATWPRTEVGVTVDGMQFPPPAGLTTWAAFMSTDDGAMVMGDTVVFQDEVSPAMDAAFAQGLEVSALHNHFFYDEPKVYFMHIGGHGDPATLARGVKAVWDAVRAVRRDHAVPSETFPGGTPTPGGTLDAEAIGRIVGENASAHGGIVKIELGRDASMHGSAFGKSMGLTTWAAFTGTDALATMDGDFAMTANEVQPVLRALRSAGIHVVALHNHMVGETPAYYFTHFWGKGPTSELAAGFKAALDAQRGAGKTR
jgi:hypothetical protein